jgi:spore coat polysaccharide biosynthesis predicted glycosyltransferase SpsG
MIRTLALVGDSGFGIGFGHLSRLISLYEKFATTNDVCFHGKFEHTDSFTRIINQHKISLDCICRKQPQTVITDTYNNEVITNLNFSGEYKLVQLIDEVSPDFFADAYIKVSPIKNWLPLNPHALIKNFENDPLLRRQFFEPQKYSISKFLETKKLLVIVGGSENGKRLLSAIADSVKDLNGKYQLSFATNETNMHFFAKELMYEVVSYEENFQSMISGYDLVISAAGVTAWELLASDANCILVSTALNQNYQLEYLRKNFDIRGLEFSSSNHSFSRDLNIMILDALNNAQAIKNNYRSKVSDGVTKISEWLVSYNLI